MRPADPQGFLILPENRLAVAAVRRLGPAGRRLQPRLVTLIGPPGCGKSHLSRELVRSWADVPDAGKTLSVTASTFAAELASASANKTIARFQSRYRHQVQLLIVEDLQAIGGKAETQQQLCAALDDILRRGGNVLFTSSQFPGAIEGLSRRLVNRLHGGLCVEMRWPKPASRAKLLKHFLQGDLLRLSAKQLEAIAESSISSPRELQGLLSELRARAGESPRSTLPAAAVAAAVAERERTGNGSLAELAQACAAQFQVSVDDLRGPRRSQSLSLARQVAMSLARELLQLHYAEIGAYFNRENHSTVIHACRKIDELIAADGPEQRQIQQLRDTLRAQFRR